MTGAAHTPGPWEVYTDGATLRVRGAGGVVIASTGAAGNPSAVANSYLMAAAPDLLAALRKTAETLRFACLAITDHDARGYALEQVTAANAAIARAEGKPA